MVGNGAELDGMTTGKIGCVVIGRNEGERLTRCLNSISMPSGTIVYVDSGSTDGSIEKAQSRGINVVHLDTRTPFTAGRARNEGFAAMQALIPDVALVQFVDGDCELDASWIETAAIFLSNHPNSAVVCGRRRERFPDASIYNQLCDVEWNTPIGEATACGGDAMMRVDSFAAVGGFNAKLIAGEEPELCARFRAAGWHIWRIDAPMTRHDAAMTSFRQWWVRAQRGGFAYGQAESVSRNSTVRPFRNERKRAIIWGGIVPALIVGSALIHPVILLVGVFVYALRIARVAYRRGPKSFLSWQYAFFAISAHFAEMQGILKFWLRMIMHKPNTAILYK